MQRGKTTMSKKKKESKKDYSSMIAVLSINVFLIMVIWLKTAGKEDLSDKVFCILCIIFILDKIFHHEKKPRMITFTFKCNNCNKSVDFEVSVSRLGTYSQEVICKYCLKSYDVELNFV